MKHNIQIRLQRFKDRAAAFGWGFCSFPVDDRTVEVFITAVPQTFLNPEIGEPSKLFLLENFALKENLGVYRPAGARSNIFTAHDLPVA